MDLNEMRSVTPLGESELVIASLRTERRRSADLTGVIVRA
jgi:hypothetical protein